MKKNIENTIEATTYGWENFNQWYGNYELNENSDQDSLLWECWKTAYQIGFNRHENAKGKNNALDY